MNADKVSELNKEIDRLTKVRTDYFKQMLKDNEEEFLKFEWLKDVKLIFQEGMSIHGYGNTEYYLRGILPHKFRDLHYYDFLVKGSDKFPTSRSENVYLTNSGMENLGSFSISSLNPKALAEFIKEYVGDGQISHNVKFSDLIELYQVLKNKEEV